MKIPRTKIRATILCARGDGILLVSKDNVRWMLPGGRQEGLESLANAAERELEEETALRSNSLTYLFQLISTTTIHHVFDAQLDLNAKPLPSNEIRHCQWLTADEVAQTNTSATTREIVRTYFSLRETLSGPEHGPTGARLSGIGLGKARASNNSSWERGGRT